MEELAKIEHAERQRLGEKGDWRKRAYEKFMKIKNEDDEDGEVSE